jgi:hypothetical protein
MTFCCRKAEKDIENDDSKLNKRRAKILKIQQTATHHETRLRAAPPDDGTSPKSNKLV